MMILKETMPFVFTNKSFQTHKITLAFPQKIELNKSKIDA